jgi:hypothetical protein
MAEPMPCASFFDSSSGIVPFDDFAGRRVREPVGQRGLAAVVPAGERHPHEPVPVQDRADRLDDGVERRVLRS